MSGRLALAALCLVGAACSGGAQRRQEKRVERDQGLFDEAMADLAERRYARALAGLQAAAQASPEAAAGEPGEAYRRLAGLLGDLEVPRRPLREADLARDAEASDAAHKAVEAYARREDLRAMLWASAALGTDPGRETFRVLLDALGKRTALPVLPEEIVPRAALVSLKLKQAETAFFDERYGEAVQACQEALILDPDNPKAWVKLGSAHYAVGETAKAKGAYSRARTLDPDDAGLRKFMAERGWPQ